MKACTLSQQGMDNLKVENVPVPKGGPTHLLIKVIAASVNPVDWKMADYGFGIQRYPAVLGCDAAGEVIEKGASVHKFEVGDIVFGLAMPPVFGSFAEYCLMDESMAIKVPHNITPEQGASFPVAIYTGYLALFSGMGFDLPVTGPRSEDRELYLYGEVLLVLEWLLYNFIPQWDIML